MITKFKIYENSSHLNINDYVICDVTPYTTNKDLINFIDNNIGEIETIRPNGYIVRYNNIPKNLEDKFGIFGIRHFGVSDIVLYASTIEELKLKMVSNKFNL